MQSINFWAILVASIASFGIGAIWYSPLVFGKEWIYLSKTTDADMQTAQTKGIWKYYISHFIATLISFTVLSFFIVSFGANTWSDGAFLGFLVWVGFIATEAVSTIIWERKPLKLVLINNINTLLTLVVGGMIIGAWL